MPDCGSTTSHRQFEADLVAKAGQIGGTPNSPAVDSMARLPTVRAVAAPLPSFSRDLDVARVRAGDLPDPTPWQEMKVCHPGYYRPAGRAPATRSAPGSTNHASCGRAVKRGKATALSFPCVQRHQIL